MRDAYSIWTIKFYWKRLIWRQEKIWQDVIEMNVRETGYEDTGLYWADLSQDRVQSDDSSFWWLYSTLLGLGRLDGGSARRKASTWTQDNTNTK
jgi:hypothetical protein